MRGRSGGMVPLGVGGIILLALISWATGTNFFSLLDTVGGPSSTTGTTGTVKSTPQEEREVDFVDAVARDVQATWADQLGGRYKATTVVLFRDTIQSAC